MGDIFFRQAGINTSPQNRTRSPTFNSNQKRAYLPACIKQRNVAPFYAKLEDIPKIARNATTLRPKEKTPLCIRITQRRDVSLSRVE